MNMQTEFKIGNYVFDFRKRTLVIGDESRKLTTREAELLLIFCENMGELVERSFILKKLWGYDDFFNARSMDVFITKIRKYLGGDQSVQLANVRGKGYRLLTGGQQA
ncbi:MAG: winged helix-turn-helix transcriptional regulator [Flavobacteriales bacterium]|nr:winged helix-turn-helix transcriptional regulator [Flavobacteriales bacterium]